MGLRLEPGYRTAPATAALLRACAQKSRKQIINLTMTRRLAWFSFDVIQFSVPGVMNFVNYGTYFTCTSTSMTLTQSVTVDAFDQDGTASGTATLILAPGKTVRFGTQLANSLTTDALLGSGTFNRGAARIVSTVNKKLICSAQLVDPSPLQPSAFNPLPVVFKFSQK